MSLFRTHSKRRGDHADGQCTYDLKRDGPCLASSQPFLSWICQGQSLLAARLDLELGKRRPHCYQLVAREHAGIHTQDGRKYEVGRTIGHIHSLSYVTVCLVIVFHILLVIKKASNLFFPIHPATASFFLSGIQPFENLILFLTVPQPGPSK